MFHTVPQESEIPESSSRFTPSRKFIGILLVFSLIISGAFLLTGNSPGKTVDDKLSQLKELRLDKRAREAIIDEQKKAIYTLDQKIIPLKCEIYSEVWAKDTWESECRDSFEDQQSKITNQVKTELEENIVPDYQ